jgi:hypothetical protein
VLPVRVSPMPIHLGQAVRVFTVRHGKIGRLDMYRTRSQALGAVGLAG